MTFDGFISYSHAADGRLAPAVQHGLHRLARPWHRLRALWIFRDQTGLAVTPGLWTSIQTALDGSRYFVLMASPEAARSPWVNKEIEHWIATKTADRILPVVTDGEWRWDNAGNDFTDDSSAVPPAIRGVFSEEPFFLDLRWARDSEHLSLRHTRFRDAIAQLAAPMHGVSKDELEGEDVRQHRRARRLLSGAAVTLLIVVLLASMTGLSAVRNAERARAAAAEALHQQSVAERQRNSAEQSAEEARRQQELARQEQIRAAQASAAAERAESMAQRQQALADKAAAEANHQRRLADQATTRRQEQQRLAKEAFRRAQRLQREADRQSRLARSAAAEARRQQAKAEEQRRIAISRRLLDQATAMFLDDPEAALALGAAAQKISADPATTRRLAAMVASTNYAGTIKGAVSAVYGPAGQLATIARNGRVSLWSLTDLHRPIRISTLKGVDAANGSLSVSANGKILVLVDTKRRVSLWDIANPSRPARLGTLPYRDVVEVALDGDGDTLVVVRESERVTEPAGAIVLWDLVDQRHPIPIATLPRAKENRISGVAVSRDGRRLVVSQSQLLSVYDLTNRAHPVSLDEKTMHVFSGAAMALSPDGSVLAIGGRDGGVELWNTATLQQFPGSLSGLADSAELLTFSSNGLLVAAADSQGKLVVWGGWQQGSLEPTMTWQSRGPIRTASFDPEGETLATAGLSNDATLWSLKPAGAPDPLSDVVLPMWERGAVFSSNGKHVIVPKSNGAADTWNIANPRRPVHGPELILRTDDFSGISWSPDRRRVATFGGQERKRLIVGQVAGRLKRVTLAEIPEHNVSSNAMAFSPDGGSFAAVTSPKSLSLWDVSNLDRPALTATLKGASFGEAVAFSPDGRTLATAAAGGSSVMLWDVTNRSAPVWIATLADRLIDATSLEFSQNGRYLASDGNRTSLGSQGETIVIWDVANRNHPRRVGNLAAAGEVLSLHGFGPDGRTMETGVTDIFGTYQGVVLWDVTGPDGPIRLFMLPIRGTEFRPDGQVVLVANRDGYTISSSNKLSSILADPATFACAIGGRGLTANEWASYVPEFPYRRTCLR